MKLITLLIILSAQVLPAGASTVQSWTQTDISDISDTSKSNGRWTGYVKIEPD